MTVAGAVLCIAVTGYLCIVGLTAWQRLLKNRRMDRAAMQLMQQRIAAASLQQRSLRQQAFLWNGVRKFVVQRRQQESHDTDSFFLRPHDGHSLPLFHAGQFLTLRLHVPGESKPVVRCYSLSNGPGSENWRITVRRTADGVASNHLHSHVQEGDILDVLAPRGDFCIAPGHSRPTVLLAGFW